MIVIKRNIDSEDAITTANDNINEYLPYCQASFNSDGNITLRNYDRSCKSKDEIIILSDSETVALFALFSSGVKCAIRDVKSQPTADVAEVKHGKWIDRGDGDWSCSECDNIFTFDAFGDIHPKYDCDCHYCPYCGAKMDGGK